MQKKHCPKNITDNYFLHMAYRINNKLTFVHIPKNAGTSISRWIEKYTRYEYDDVRHQHVSLLPSEWQNNIFVVVRNPWARAVSWYLFVQQMLNKKNIGPNKQFIHPQLTKLGEGFENFVTLYSDRVFTKSKFALGPHIMTLKSIAQVNYLDDKFDGTVLRYENLDQDWKKIQDLIGCHIHLPITNKTVFSSTKNWQSFYTERTKAVVAKLFEKDIERFRYSFNS